MADPWDQLHNTLIELMGQAAEKVKVGDSVSDPGIYDGSPTKFFEWWGKMKVWVDIGIAKQLSITTQDVTAAVLLCLTGSKLGRWAQMKLQPLWVNLQTEVEMFFLLGNHTDWTWGPCQRVDDFLMKFEALKVQSGLGRAIELFYINTLSSAGTTSGARVPMDTGAGPGPQCYNCQEHDHIV
ncbi:hypothetical protein V8B97DRAFT_2025028 [Scleroderma yunnanense]